MLLYNTLSRMFAYMAGIPLCRNISRRRRIVFSRFDLQRELKKIIDIGMKYGYSSPTAFNRAFQNVHGHTAPFNGQERRRSE